MGDIAELLKDPELRQQYVKLPATYRAAFEWRSLWLTKAHAHQV